jgi:hypothetical protein
MGALQKDHSGDGQDYRSESKEWSMLREHN